MNENDKRVENNRPQFKIYRKPTHSNLYIHAFSGHSDKIKKQPLIIYFKEPINYVIHNSLIMKLNPFIKSLKI